MRFIFILIAILKVTSVHGQDYLHYIIPTQEPNFSIKKLILNGDQLIIPYDYVNSDFKTNGVILKTDLSIQMEYYMDNIDLGINPMISINNEHYIVGKHPENENIAAAKLNLNLDDQLWYENYSIQGISGINAGFSSIEDTLYAVHLNNLSSGNQVMQILKIGNNGQALDNRLFNEEYRLSYTRGFETTSDNHLILSSWIVQEGIMGSLPQLKLFDSELNEIWEHLGGEVLISGRGVFVAELSNSNFVQSYSILADQAPDVRLRWYDKNGNYVFNKLIESTDKNEIIISNIESGKGDYFFAYGEYTLDHPELGGDNEYFGMITKFNNQGDTIWSHWYQHPDFQNIRVLHNINDIIELDNGDIWALGTIQDILVDPERKIWLFKINEHGCLKDGLTDCDQIVTSTKDLVAAPLIDQWKVIPNPSTGIYQISSDEIHRLERIEIYNQQGQRLKSINHITNYIDLIDFPDGFYNVRMYLNNGMYVMKRVVKI